MKHFGAICDPAPGQSHLMAMVSIGRALQSRGHKVTLFTFSETPDDIQAQGVPVWKLPEKYAKASQEYVARLQTGSGASLLSFLKYSVSRAETLCSNGPDVLKAAELDCVLVDMGDPGSSTAAELSNLPFITISNALPLNRDPSVPPDFLPWNYRPERWAELRNLCAYRLRDLLIAPLHGVINKYRKRHRLSLYRAVDDSFSTIAQITQLVPEFDLPRQRLPKCFHYVGPYRRANESHIGSDIVLDGRPLIYASLGTLQGNRESLWTAIARACSSLDVQLVIALGKRGLSQQMPRLPGDPTVVDFAPQRALLNKASVAITHAGLNSAMEALAAGTPMLALPITGDQFGVSARIAHTHTGPVLGPSERTEGAIRAALTQLLSDHSYRECARAIQGRIANTRGADAAAELIESAVSKLG